MLFEEYNVETAIQVAKEETREETRRDERTGFAVKLLQKGFTDKDIIELTGIPAQQIAKLKGHR